MSFAMFWPVNRPFLSDHRANSRPEKVFHVRFVYANSLGDRSIVKQDACTGVHSACRREENWAQSGYLCTTPSTAQAGADASQIFRFKLMKV